MNLKDWEKLSPVEQQAYFAGASQEEKRALIEADQSRQEKIWETSKCPAGLIELRNQLKKEIDDELNASSQYREASAKMVHYGHGSSAYHLKQIAQQELMHHYVIRQIVDIITEECGE